MLDRIQRNQVDLDREAAKETNQAAGGFIVVVHAVDQRIFDGDATSRRQWITFQRFDQLAQRVPTIRRDQTRPCLVVRRVQ